MFMTLIAVMFTAFGTAIASVLSDFQGFQMVMNFLVMLIFGPDVVRTFPPPPRLRRAAEAPFWGAKAGRSARRSRPKGLHYTDLFTGAKGLHYTDLFTGSEGLHYTDFLTGLRVSTLYCRKIRS